MALIVELQQRSTGNLRTTSINIDRVETIVQNVKDNHTTISFGIDRWIVVEEDYDTVMRKIRAAQVGQ